VARWRPSSASEGRLTSGPLRAGNIVAAAEPLNAVLAAAGADKSVTVEVFEGPATGHDQDALDLLKACSIDQGPDLYVAAPAWVGEFARNGNAMDMEAFVAANPWAFADVIPVLWEATKYQGRIHAIPQDSEIRMFFYNKDIGRAQVVRLNARNGVTPENNTAMSWDELRSAFKQEKAFAFQQGVWALPEWQLGDAKGGGGDDQRARRFARGRGQVELRPGALPRSSQAGRSHARTADPSAPRHGAVPGPACLMLFFFLAPVVVDVVLAFTVHDRERRAARDRRPSPAQRARGDGGLRPRQWLT
jgi:hypothetical protein